MKTFSSTLMANSASVGLLPQLSCVPYLCTENNIIDFFGLLLLPEGVAWTTAVYAVAEP